MKQYKKLFKKIISYRLFWPTLALVLLLLLNLIFIKDFFVIEIKDGHLYGSLIDILRRGAPLMLIVIGLTLVIAAGGIDISIGSVVAIAGITSATLIGGKMVFVNGVQQYVSLIPMPLAIIITLAVASLCGLWNGLLVSKLGLQAYVATLILQVAGRGIAQLISKGNVLTVYYKPFFFIGSGYIMGLPFSIFIVAAVLLLVMLLVKKTAFGLFLESICTNRLASKFAGLNVQKITLTCYVICGLCAGIAGILITSEIKSADGNNTGLFMELDAVLAYAVAGNNMKGGRFSLPASVIGALIIQTLTTTIYAMGIAPEVTMVVKAVVVILVCLIQSDMFKKLFVNKSKVVNKSLGESKEVEVAI